MKPIDPQQDASVERQVRDLPNLRKRELATRWREVFKREPPSSFGPDLMRRGIAYRIQEQAYGGLGISTQKRLDALIKTFSKSPQGDIALPRRIKTGAILVREWQGKTYRVTVVADDFIYNEVKYTNLSEIARKITGTRWNGPRFFGLRKKITKIASENMNEAAVEANR